VVCDGTTSNIIVNYQDELMVVVAIENLNVYTGIRHTLCQLAKLARHRLFQPQNNDFPHPHNFDSGLLKRLASRITIGKQKVRCAATVDNPSSAAFYADSDATQRLTHLGQTTWAVLKFNGKIHHMYS
jgi:hypothetical protein